MKLVPIIQIMPEVKADADVTVSCGAYVFDGIQHERGTVTVDLAGQKTIIFECEHNGTAVRIAVVCQGREQCGVVVKVGVNNNGQLLLTQMVKQGCQRDEDIVNRTFHRLRCGVDGDDKACVPQKICGIQNIVGIGIGVYGAKLNAFDTVGF